MSAQAAVALALDESPQLELAFKIQECRGEALVVDDNPDITYLLAVVLQRAGYDVSTAYSASNALETALAKHFDVIVSDIGMPGMTGYELAQILRAMPEYRSIPMVAVTGFDMYDDRDRALHAGFNAHFRKPIDMEALTREIFRIRH
jgi:CheY-like chemotaxis protein